MLGPNVKRLIAHKMSLDAIPKGGGVADGLKFLLDKERIVKAAREADEWVKSCIAAVRKAAEPNPFREAPDEDIAAEILRKIEERKIARRTAA